MPADLHAPPFEAVPVGDAAQHDPVAVVPNGLLGLPVVVAHHHVARLLDHEQLIAVAAALRDRVAQAAPRLDVAQLVEHEPGRRLDLAQVGSRRLARQGEILARLLERVQQEHGEQARVHASARLRFRPAEHVHGVMILDHAPRIDQTRVARREIHRRTHLRVREDRERVPHAEPFARPLARVHGLQATDRVRPAQHLPFARMLADQVRGLERLAGADRPLVAFRDRQVADRRRIQKRLDIASRAHAPLPVVRPLAQSAHTHQGLRAAHRRGRVLAPLQRGPTHVVPGQRIRRAQSLRVEDMDTATAAVPGPVRRIRHTPLPQATGRRDDVAARRRGQHEAGRLHHRGDHDRHCLAGPGRSQHVRVHLQRQPDTDVMAFAHVHGRLPGPRPHRVAAHATLPHGRGQHGRQHARHHRAHHLAHPARGRDLTTRGHARSRGQAIHEPFPGITVRVPERPQHGAHGQRGHPEGHGQQPAGHRVAARRREQQQRERHRHEQDAHGQTTHQHRPLTRQGGQKPRMLRQPHARTRVLEPTPHGHDPTARIDTRPLHAPAGIALQIGRQLLIPGTIPGHIRHQRPPHQRIRRNEYGETDTTKTMRFRPRTSGRSCRTGPTGSDRPGRAPCADAPRRPSTPQAPAAAWESPAARPRSDPGPAG